VLTGDKIKLLDWGRNNYTLDENGVLIQ